MNILNLAGELFLLYLLYKFIFNFIIPVYQATTRVKRQFDNMQQKMQEPPPKPQTPTHDEYIDYEEIKWGGWFLEGLIRLTFRV